jgi:hypothetical protein
MTQGIERDPDKRIDGDRGTYDIKHDSESNEGRASGTAGLPTEGEVPQETVDEIEKDRQERLDPENRPDGTEIDNTDRTFDSGAGKFTDDEDYDSSERPFVTEEGVAPPAPDKDNPQNT